MVLELVGAIPCEIAYIHQTTPVLIETEGIDQINELRSKHDFLTHSIILNSGHTTALLRRCKLASWISNGKSADAIEVVEGPSNHIETYLALHPQALALDTSFQTDLNGQGFLMEILIEELKNSHTQNIHRRVLAGKENDEITKKMLSKTNALYRDYRQYQAILSFLIACEKEEFSNLRESREYKEIINMLEGGFSILNTIDFNEELEPLKKAA